MPSMPTISFLTLASSGSLPSRNFAANCSMLVLSETSKLPEALDARCSRLNWNCCAQSVAAARRPGRWFVRVSLFGPFQLHLHAIQLAAGDPHGGHNLLFGKLSLIKVILAPGLTGSHHHQHGGGDGQPPRPAVEARAH